MTVHEATTQDTGVREALTRLSSQDVIISGPDSVRDYLIAHPHVISALPYAVSEAQSEYGPDVQVILRVDRSSGPGNEYLVLVLRLPQYQEDDSLARFTHELTRQARERMSQREPRFVVTSDFVFAS